jgi:hypothetical protein
MPSPLVHNNASVKNLIASSAAAFSLATAAAIASPAVAQETQFSGTEILSKVEAHSVAADDGSGQVYGVEKWVGTASVPGLFDAVRAIIPEGFRYDPKSGQGECWGSKLWTNNDGTMTATYKCNFGLTMNDKGQPRSSTEGTVEIAGGTGRFANLHGHGTYSGNAEGSDFVGRINLSVTGFEKRASTQ